MTGYGIKCRHCVIALYIWPTRAFFFGTFMCVLLIVSVGPYLINLSSTQHTIAFTFFQFPDVPDSHHNYCEWQHVHCHSYVCQWNLLVSTCYYQRPIVQVHCSLVAPDEHQLLEAFVRQRCTLWSEDLACNAEQTLHRSWWRRNGQIPRS